MTQSLGKFESHQQQQQNQVSMYAKTSKTNYNTGYLSDKNSRSTNNTNSNSDIDMNACNAFFELNGFKIVHNGKTIYSETSDGFESSSTNTDSAPEEYSSNTRFASSEFTIGPCAKEISIPLFMGTEPQSVAC